MTLLTLLNVVVDDVVCRCGCCCRRLLMFTSLKVFAVVIVIVADVADGGIIAVDIIVL